MAKLAKPILFTGRMGHMTAYIDHYGNYIIKEAFGPPADQLKHSPKYEKFRGNSKEFGLASSAGARLRFGMAEHTATCRDARVVKRVTKAMQAVIRSGDDIHLGSRTVSGGNIELLEGTEWHGERSLEDILKADYAGFIDPVTGKMHVIIESFGNRKANTPPEGARHFQLFASGVALHPEKKNWSEAHATTELLPLKARKTASTTLSLQVDTTDKTVLVLGLGIRFFHEVRGVQEALDGGAFAIVKTGKVGSIT